jgi:hypothetical protein
MGANKFIFVVCGSSEHIDALHFSLQYLKKYSKNEILILTDSKRNEALIKHDKIIDIETPAYYNHHQASIFLKTSIHKYFPVENNYCYLDTDVIALNHEVDDIFMHQHGIITFAPDHCSMQKFSPHAVNCGCYNEQIRLTEILEKHLLQFDLNRTIIDPELKKKHVQLLREFELMKQNKMKYMDVILRYRFSPFHFKLHNDAFFNKRKLKWIDKEGNIILYDQRNFINKVESTSGFKWDKKAQTWRTKEGKNIYYAECNHLIDSIKSKFSIDVLDKNFQHWNGGVFLFNRKSHEFLNSWHRKTMEIFSDTKWKTRDQGTLIATVWEFKINKYPTLSKKFNFIADYKNPKLVLNKNTGELTDDLFKSFYKPSFIHIYHHFGAKGWDVWDWVESKL